LCAETYIVVITDANSCTSFSSISITEPDNITVGTLVTDGSCYGSCDGSAEAIVTGGTMPYNYQWNDPNLQTASGISNLCAGTYQVIVTDSNDCISVNDVIVDQPSLLTMVVDITSANCGQSNGSACVSVVGGISPYAYYWSDPSNQQSSCAQNIPSGSYVATITDGNNCRVDSVININDISGPTINHLLSVDAICYGGNSGSIQMDVNGGTLPYSTFRWIDNSSGGPVGPSNNPNLPGIRGWAQSSGKPSKQQGAIL